MATLTRLAPIDGEAILPLTDCKAHLRVSHDSEDALIGSLRNAAIGHVERVSGVALASGQWRWALPRFTSRIELPIGPVTAVDAVTYLDADGATQTYADARLIEGQVYPASGGSWPAAYDSVAVEFTAGLEGADEAPELLAAVMLLLGHLYLHREATTADALKEVPLGVDALIGTYRKVLV